MAKDEQSNQLNLTVVALVALVAIVGLVALVMNAASITSVPQFATGSEFASADEGNLLGDVRRTCSPAGADRAIAYNCGELSGEEYRECALIVLDGCTR